MDATAYRAQIARLGLTQGAAGRLLGVDPRTSRKWANGERVAPPPVQRLLWACERDPALMAAIRDHWLGDDAAEDEQAEE